jgi:putative inorganic carbon (HCO3(-)) transporter
MLRWPDAAAPVRTAGWQLAIAVCGGLAVALLVSTASPLLIVGGIAAFLLFVVFLQRPDIGLLAVLLMRASTDVVISSGHGGIAVTGNVLSRAILDPNTGLIAILILGGVLFMLSRRLPLVGLPGGSLLVILLAVGAIGVLRAESKFFSMNEWLRLAAAPVVYSLAAYLLSSGRWVQRTVDVLALSFVAPALVGLDQLITGHTRYVLGPEIRRIYGTFVHPNPFGLYLVVIISVFMCQALVHSGARRMCSLVIVAVSSVLLLGTYARFAWAGVLIVMLVIGVLRWRPLVALVLCLVLGAALVPSVSTRLADPFGGGSFTDHVLLWQLALRQWADATRDPTSSVVTLMNRLGGLGPGAVEVITAPLRGVPTAAHDDYIRMLIEYGAIGLLAFLALTVVLIFAAYRAWRAAPSGTRKAVALSFFALTLAYPVMSFTSNVFATTQNQVYFWTLAGITVGAAAGAWERRPARAPRLDPGDAESGAADD